MFVPKSESTIKVYEQKNAIHKNTSLGDYYISKKYFETKMKSFEVFPGDIIVSCAGTIGETYILPKDIERGIINQALMRMKITDKINIGYFLMFFDHILKDEAAKSGKGTAIKNIPPFDVFKQFLIPLPPLNEQQLIVAEIVKIFAQIDLLEQNKTDLQTAIKQAKSKVLDLAIHGKLVSQDPNDEPASVLLEKIRAEKEEKIARGELKRDKNDSYIYKSTTDNCHYEKLNGKDVSIEDKIPFTIPKSWQWCRLGEICEKLVDGNHNPPKGVENKTAYLMLSSRNINKNTIVDLENVRYLTKEMFEIENKRTQLTSGDILFTSVGSLGRSCVFHGTNNFCFQRSVTVIDTKIDNYWIKYFFDSNYYQDYVIENATGTAQLGFYMQQMSDSFVVIPPLSEQKRIVAKIEELFSLLDQIQTNIV